MAVMEKNGGFHIDFRPFQDKKVRIKLIGVTSKKRAREIETEILMAIRTGRYEVLSVEAHDAVVRIYRKHGLELPPVLAGNSEPKKDLTLKEACRIFLTDPEVKDSEGRWRHECSILNIVEKLGEDMPINEIKIPNLKLYRKQREAEGRTPATINRELSALSGVFRVLQENDLVETNPVCGLKRLSTNLSERQVYLSRDYVEMISDKCPAWFRPLIWTAYHTGMRRGEILGLTRKQVNLSQRMIQLFPVRTKEHEGTKEHGWKRVPIHKYLVPILEKVLSGPALISGEVFPLVDDKGIRGLGLETFKNPWERACKSLKLEKPLPRFHDLRHTWKTNARRSRMHPELEMAIMGHSTRGRSVHERYGRISDQELIDAIDQMTFDHGETEIFVAGKRVSQENGDCVVTGGLEKKKGHAVT